MLAPNTLHQAFEVVGEAGAHHEQQNLVDKLRISITEKTEAYDNFDGDKRTSPAVKIRKARGADIFRLDGVRSYKKAGKQGKFFWGSVAVIIVLVVGFLAKYA
jgi:hypothetical protein